MSDLKKIQVDGVLYDVNVPDGKIGTEQLKDGKVALADNLASWAARQQMEVVDEWSTPVRTTGGSLSIDTSKGAYILRLQSKGAFKATALMASGGNQLNPSATVGGAYVFIVPKMVQGSYGTADEANGILFVNRQGQNIKPTVRFSETYPSSASDGVAVNPYQFAGHSEWFYPSSGIGYFIVSDLGADAADVCARIAWSTNYNLFEEYAAPSSVNLASVISALVASHSSVSDKMLAVGTLSDEIVFSSNVARWYRRVSAITPVWTNEDLGEGRYLHTAEIPATNGLMKADGQVEDMDGTQIFNVDGTTVSFEDSNATANKTVKYELNDVVTGEVSQSNEYAPNDFGIEYLTGESGDFVISTSYYQGIPDSIYALLDRVAKLEALDEDVDSLIADTEGERDNETIPLLCGQPMILFGSGAPTDGTAPSNWISLADGGYDWNGTPSALGQTYINVSAESNGRYTAVRNGNMGLTWVNF